MADSLANAFNRSSRDEVLEAVGSTRMNDDDFTPNVNGNFKRAASFRQSIRGRRLPSSAASPAGVRRTPSMRTSGGASTTMSSSPTATNNLDDISDEVGEDAVAEEFFSQLSQMNDRIAAMTQAQAEKELHAKSGEQRLMQENGRLQERCASLELQYSDLERHYQQLMQKERDHYKQMQARAEQEREFMQAKWEEEKQQLKETLAVLQRESADVKKQMEVEKAQLERLRVEKPWLEEKANREAAQAREALQEIERLRRDLNEAKQEQDQLDASYHDEIKALQSQVADLSYSSSTGDQEREQLIEELKIQIDRLRQDNGELREQNTELHLAVEAAKNSSANRAVAPATDSLASQLAEAAVQGGFAGKLLGYPKHQQNLSSTASSRDGSRTNSMVDGSSSSTDAVIGQQREQMRSKSTTCELCKKKDEEFFRVQSYLENLVQRVIDTHPEILEIRPSKTNSTQYNGTKSQMMKTKPVAAEPKNPFEEEVDPTNPFEEPDNTDVSNGIVNGKRRASKTEPMQIDGDDDDDNDKPPSPPRRPRVINHNANNRSTTPVGSTASSLSSSSTTAPTTVSVASVSSQKRNGGQKLRAPRPPSSSNSSTQSAAAGRGGAAAQRNRQNGTPVSEC